MNDIKGIECEHCTNWMRYDASRFKCGRALSGFGCAFESRDGWKPKTYEELEKENTRLIAQIEKMKCCENCKYNSYWGNELHCNYGLKEALQEDKLVECKKMDKWEIKENEI